MFDFHMHTTVSYDGHNTGAEMALAARNAGLKEICFTDHLDYDPRGLMKMDFDTDAYNAAYDGMEVPGLTIRRGAEFGMLRHNPEQLKKDLQRRHFDFIIGSCHFTEDLDIYFPPFWEGKTMEQAETLYLEEVLSCVQAHDDFDVLGHLTYISKAASNPTHRPVAYERYRELVDEILRTLARKGKGMEVNTSGMARCGVFLPEAVYLRRFKELGGQIVTVGSDAHDVKRVGENCLTAARMVADIFGYVCTFHDRKPVFHSKKTLEKGL